MKNILGIGFLVISTFSEAAIVCPSMPGAVTSINRDIKSEIEASAGKIGRVSAGNVAIKTEVVAKNLFDKFPNVDRSLALQTMAATYCSMLKNSNLNELEVINRWETFQDKVLDIQTASDKQFSQPTVTPSKPKITTKGFRLSNKEIDFGISKSELKKMLTGEIANIDEREYDLINNDGAQVYGLGYIDNYLGHKSRHVFSFENGELNKVYVAFGAAEGECVHGSILCEGSLPTGNLSRVNDEHRYRQICSRVNDIYADLKREFGDPFETLEPGSFDIKHSMRITLNCPKGDKLCDISDATRTVKGYRFNAAQGVYLKYISGTTSISMSKKRFGRDGRDEMSQNNCFALLVFSKLRNE